MIRKFEYFNIYASKTGTTEKCAKQKILNENIDRFIKRLDY